MRRYLPREPAVIYALCLVGLMLIGAFSRQIPCTSRIKLGAVNIQPSELAKLAAILYLAWFLDMRRRTAVSLEFTRRDFVQTLLPAVAPILVCVALILAQPDLGTSVDIVLIMTAILFVAGLSWKWLVVGFATALPILILLITHVSYRQARLMAFLHPDNDPQGAGFQLLQSLIAIGSGGFSGVGLMESKQKLFYLPEAHTDFIYAVICEELGFIGATIIIALFCRICLSSPGALTHRRLWPHVASSRPWCIPIAISFAVVLDDAHQRNSTFVGWRPSLLVMLRQLACFNYSAIGRRGPARLNDEITVPARNRAWRGWRCENGCREARRDVATTQRIEMKLVPPGLPLKPCACRPKGKAALPWQNLAMLVSGLSDAFGVKAHDPVAVWRRWLCCRTDAPRRLAKRPQRHFEPLPELNSLTKGGPTAAHSTGYEVSAGGSKASN
jgi:hypothetical protein